MRVAAASRHGRPSAAARACPKEALHGREPRCGVRVVEEVPLSRPKFVDEGEHSPVQVAYGHVPQRSVRVSDRSRQLHPLPRAKMQIEQLRYLRKGKRRLSGLKESAKREILVYLHQ